jgi:iron(III) transport system permease protein
MHKKIGFTYPFWATISLLLIVCLVLPLLFLLIYVFKPEGQAWQSIVEYDLFNQTANTLLLILLVVPITVFLGTWFAWIVSAYEFRGRKILSWALLLPLTFPTYIMAFTQAQLFSYGGLFSKVSKMAGAEKAWHIDLLHLPGLVVVLSLSLYPYVYLPVKIALRSGMGPYIEAARNLGKNNTNIFFKIALPLMRPAIAGGAFLVAMEVLNDYGAVKYYGISTLTTGIFSAWFASNDLVSAVRISFILLIIALVTISAERYQRRRKSYISARRQKNLMRENPQQWKKFLYPLLIIIFLLFAFLVPISQLISDTIKNSHLFKSDNFGEMAFNSIGIALFGSVLVTSFAFLVLFGQRINNNLFLTVISRSFAIGYALPGAVIAVSVMIISSMIDNSLNTYLIGGSIIGLLFAFLVRFIAIGYNTLNSGFERQSKNIDKASLNLGISPFNTLKKINIPISYSVLMGSFLLCFVDMIKELPLTYILRPFNFHTFSTKAFDYASDEMLAKAALPSLCIVILGSLPLILFNKSLEK